MKLKSLLSGALNVVGAFIPGVAIAAKAVNVFLPDDKKIDLKNSTGQDVINVYDNLTPDQQAQIDQQVEVEMANIQASVDKLQSMVSAETATANTRPYIAKLMAWAVFIAVMFMMIFWGKAVWVKDVESLKQLAESWPLMLSILATPTALLRAYFGMRTKEKQARYAAVTGQPIADAVGGFSRLWQKMK